MLYWDPRPEVFTIPFLNWPILWYGVLFALGFAIGFPLFVSILSRYFMCRPEYEESDILKPEELTGWGKSKREIVMALNEQITRGNDCLQPKKATARLVLDRQLGKAVLGIRRKAVQLTDRLTLYMVMATIIGARLGHFFFYEKPSTYLRDPWEFFRIREGGLASHGGLIAIILVLVIFSYRIREKVKGLTWIRLLDFVCVPTAFVGCCIRIGNFFNQEILGLPTHLPWAVVFGHPIDQSLPIPRHPVQLYEAFFYLTVFAFLWVLSYRPYFLLTKGKLVGLFLMLVFGFRFLVEFLKEEQSFLITSFPLTMGQILSIPVIVLGCVFFFLETKKSNILVLEGD